MKKHKGSMIAYLNQTTQSAAQTDSGYRVEQIGAERIIPNEKNFYSIEGVEEMANSLAVSDHMPPLEVVANGNGTYRLISGERRLSATLCRIQRGELKKAELPCHVLPAFTAKGALSAEQVEMLHIILANNYRQKTALDQLNEVRQMEPIARAIYEDAKEKGALAESEGSSLNMCFRTFFAKEILDISEAKLQRLQSLARLTEEAKKAFDEGLIGQTIAVQMAALSAKEQDSIVKKIRNGTCGGTYAEFKNWLEGKNGESNISDHVVDKDENKAKAVSTTEEAPESATAISADSEDEDWESVGTDTGDVSDAASPHSSLSVGQTEKEANLWVAERLQALIEEVDAKIQAAEATHQPIEAARWEVRRSAIRLIIETIS